jgi:hypothetical protein
VALIALVAYWPPYESHFAGSDASAYLAAGVHLATTHRFDKPDPLAAELYPRARREIFTSVFGHEWKPPFTRMPGGMVLESPDAPVAHPNFFPAACVWSALFTSALGPRLAGGFAPLFAALAGWAFWVCARRRTGPLAAATVTVLAMCNAPAYFAARLSMSEPLAWFLVWAALAVMEAWESDGAATDARVAGFLLGMVGFVRIEYALFLMVALALRSLLVATLGARPLTPGFVAGLALATACTSLEVLSIRGAYIAPIVDALEGVRFRVAMAWLEQPWRVAGVTLTGGTLALVSIRTVGLRRTLLATGVLGFIVGYTIFASNPRALRSGGWMLAYFGWPTLLLALVGLRWTWRARHRLPGDGFLVLLVALIGGLVLYDPHVYPAMPWAARRFVPLIIPAGLLMASVAASALLCRSRLLGRVAWAALALAALVPARPIWGHAFFRGAYEQLTEFNALVPKESVLLIDARVAPLVLGTPLWLAHDRESLPVNAMGTDGRKTISGIAFTLHPRHRLFLVKPILAPEEPIPFVRQVKAADYTFQVLLPEQTEVTPPRLRQDYTTSVALYELIPWRRAPAAAPAATPPTAPR